MSSIKRDALGFKTVTFANNDLLNKEGMTH